jgi:hypothetical protein
MELTPSVSPADEFLEIANDFTDPKEVVREAISNAFDAGARVIRVLCVVDKSTGTDELVLTIEDDGEGMTEAGLGAFFGLGHSTRRARDAHGNKASSAIGEKGHGTKICFNSRRVELTTQHDGKRLVAHMDDPKKSLRRGELPKVVFEAYDTDAADGTTIKIYGYNDNNQCGFDHGTLKDYIYWFTKFGSFENELGIVANTSVVLHLRGLGWLEAAPEAMSFGHPFPLENTNLTTLKKADKVAPLDYYVARWVLPSVPVIGMPNSTIDIVFYIEGDQAKRQYNPMIHQKYKMFREGEYTVEQRYGLWLAKDYIPIVRKNEWVAEKSEWTKFHAFVNSQDFRLTANRADLDNTPPKVLLAIRNTVEAVFREQIVTSQHYRKYQDELQQQQQYRDAEAEEKAFDRRKKAALKQKVAEYQGRMLVEPRQEGGVFSLVMQLLTLKGDIFGFTVVDYDTAFGYDLLVTKDTALDLNRAALRFVEMKYELKREFSHSFSLLAAVICWDTELSNQDEVIDLRGNKRILRITPRPAESANGYTKFMLVSDTEEHNIEVFVLREFLKDSMGIDFKVRTKD